MTSEPGQTREKLFESSHFTGRLFSQLSVQISFLSGKLPRILHSNLKSFLFLVSISKSVSSYVSVSKFEKFHMSS